MSEFDGRMSTRTKIHLVDPHSDELEFLCRAQEGCDAGPGWARCTTFIHVVDCARCKRIFRAMSKDEQVKMEDDLLNRLKRRQ